ncbi:MAG: hypothetical protein GOU99_02520 [Candidatus Altiarchaeota archaeon]|nr:hypothetical protein [Candidatus Altiarchaeota archaeon]
MTKDSYQEISKKYRPSDPGSTVHPVADGKVEHLTSMTLRKGVKHGGFHPVVYTGPSKEKAEK